MDAQENDPIIVLSDTNFEEEILKYPGVAFVDFWAVWCPPCKIIAPTIHEIAHEMEGKVKVGKLDVDPNPNMTSQYGVMSIPTLIIFVNGKEFDRFVGVREKSDIIGRLEKALASSKNE